MNAEVLFIIVIGIFILKGKLSKNGRIGLILLLIGTIFLATNGNIQYFSHSQRTLERCW
jgi:drug/metabolite transporter (DMT)-like permease